MKKKDHVILGVHVTNRAKRAERVQKVLTAHGAFIKTRIGLHEADGRGESPGGVILLEVVGGAKPVTSLTQALKKIKGIEVRQMVFGHE